MLGGLEKGSRYRIPKPFKVIEEVDSEVIVQRLERDGSLPKSAARTLLSRLGCFGGSSSGSTGHHQTLKSTGDVALQAMEAAVSTNTLLNSYTQPPGSQTQSSGFQRQHFSSQTYPFSSQRQPSGSQAHLSGSQTQPSDSRAQPSSSQNQHLSRSSKEAVERNIALAILKGYSERGTHF